MEVIWLIFVVAIGLCVGSFLNVVIYRLPRGESIVFPGSHCPSCGRAIHWFDNIPIFSWMLLGGKCRNCKKPISPRYLLVEALTAVVLGGLFACLFLLDIRDHAGSFGDSWPMFIGYATLLAGLLVCSIVDIQMWIVPLEVCWFVSLVGLICAAADPHPFLSKVSPTSGAMALAAAVGLAVSILLTKLGLLQPSFVDARDNAVEKSQSDDASNASGKGEEKITAVAIGKEHGVNPRAEILREVLFLAPAFVLAIGAYLLVTEVDWARDGWNCLTRRSASGAFALHFNSFLAALFGYLIGGLWIWGMRILGTLGFGKEAMGLGDVHIMAAVGAVTGWAVPSVAFFVAPFFALMWAVYLWGSRRQRELPYGPWLAVATVVVILFYDAIAAWMGPQLGTVKYLLKGS